MTGLAAGIVSGLPIYEAEKHPGGICSSYYLRPGDPKRLPDPPADGAAFRFEIGGGHWIHSRDPMILHFIQSMVPMKSYTRLSSVYFPDKDIFVPYPLQNNLRCLGPKLAARALSEMVERQNYMGPLKTMADWLLASFGPTLCELFFDPFHELYTGGLCNSIAAQDSYKSIVNLPLAIKGALEESPQVGYNVTFAYPTNGLNDLARQMAAASHIHYGKRLTSIDVHSKELTFNDGTLVRYDKLISTIPLNLVLEISNLKVSAKPDPYTSTLVLNIGAVKGKRCPQEHWLYIPQSQAGFHRVGFYSNVDNSFLPVSGSSGKDWVGIYVERAYAGGQKPSSYEIELFIRNAVQALIEWEWIKETELVDHTWIEIAYSWSWPGSRWQQEALRALKEHGIFQVGRFACWLTQGIADSIKDGLMAGIALRHQINKNK